MLGNPDNVPDRALHPHELLVGEQRQDGDARGVLVPLKHRLRRVDRAEERARNLGGQPVPQLGGTTWKRPRQRLHRQVRGPQLLNDPGRAAVSTDEHVLGLASGSHHGRA